MNPLDETLEHKTDFIVRYSINLDVKVDDAPSTCNGQRTGLDRARELAKLRIGKILRAIPPELMKPDVRLHYDEFGDVEHGAEVIDPKWLEVRGRLFERMLFLGDGDYSGRNGTILQARLHEALYRLGGLQQPCHDYDNSAEIEEDEKYIEDVVRDVAMALTGREIVLLRPMTTADQERL